MGLIHTRASKKRLIQSGLSRSVKGHPRFLQGLRTGSAADRPQKTPSKQGMFEASLCSSQPT